MRLSRYLIVLSALWAFTLAGCAGGEDGDTAASAHVSAPADALRQAFPDQAALVLDGPASFELDETGGLFVAGSKDPRREPAAGGEAL